MAALAALELESKLMKILRENDTVFTRDLVKQLNPFNKQEIQQQLYKYQRNGIVDRVSQSPPAWRLMRRNDGNSSATGRLDCQEISKSPRPDPSIEDLEELLIQYLKKQTDPVKVGVIARALKVSNVKKISAALYSMKKLNLVKLGKEGRAHTWMINWNVVEKDEETFESAEENFNQEDESGINEGVEQSVDAASNDESGTVLREGPAASKSHTEEAATADADMVTEEDGNDHKSGNVHIKQEKDDGFDLSKEAAASSESEATEACEASVFDVKPEPYTPMDSETSSQEIDMPENVTDEGISFSAYLKTEQEEATHDEQTSVSMCRTNMFYANAASSEYSESNDQDDMEMDATNQADNDASQISDSILACLAKTPNGRLLLKEIIKRVGAQRKKDINRHLYSMEKSGLLAHVQQVPPVWGLTPKGREAAKSCQQTPRTVLFSMQKRLPAGQYMNQLNNKGIPMSPMTLIQQQKAWASDGHAGMTRSPEMTWQASHIVNPMGHGTSDLTSASTFVPPKPPSLLNVTSSCSGNTGGTSLKPLLGIGRGQVMTVPKPVGIVSSSPLLSPAAQNEQTSVASPSLGSGNRASRCAARFSAPETSGFKITAVGSFQASQNSNGATGRPSPNLSGFNKPFQLPKPQLGTAPPRLPSGPPPSPMELLQSNTVFAAHPATGKKVNVSGFGPLNVSSNAKSDRTVAANKINAPGFGPIRVSPSSTPDPTSNQNPFMKALQQPLLSANSPSNNASTSYQGQISSNEGPTSVLESGSIPQLDMSALSSDSFAALNKNPISALMEYAQSRKMTATIEMLGQAGPSHNPKFRIAARVGNRLFQEVISRNKKDGRREAADVALRNLISEGQYQVAQSSKNNLVERVQKLGLKITFFDKMAAMAHHAFNNLVAMVLDSMSGRKVLAALVMKRSDDDEGEVISVGTGNRCIEGIYLSLEGKTVNDSHAEIVTRRGFVRFVYKNLLAHQPGTAESLFQYQTSSRGKLVLKPGISFHLYISTAPCGDGALFSPTDVDNDPMSVDENMDHDPIFTSQIQGVLRTKVERGEGTIPIEPGFKGQTWDGVLRGERLRTMSCSDKICRWNILGMQGALLSYFLEPIYLGSLTLGYLYVHGHLSRAVCCRLDNKEPDVTSSLPEGYKVNHPNLGRVTAYDPPRETEKTTSVSINWILGDKKPEVTDGTKGCIDSKVQDNRVSQITKLRLYSLFKQVCQKYNRTELLNAESYNAAKLGARDFQEAKSVMKMKFKKSYKSTWVSKPPEEEMFS